MTRLLIMAAAGRLCHRPTRPWQRALMLTAARKVTGLADWVAYRASMAVAELEDLDT
jgi:hypothetical protein